MKEIITILAVSLGLIYNDCIVVELRHHPIRSSESTYLVKDDSVYHIFNSQSDAMEHIGLMESTINTDTVEIYIRDDSSYVEYVDYLKIK